MRPSILALPRTVGLVLAITCLGLNFTNASVTDKEAKNPSRYAPNVISITHDHDYIRLHDAPIYWKISPFYQHQPTDASCSLASATMVINALRIPQMKYANQQLATPLSVVHSVDLGWENHVKQGGDGVTLDQFGSFLTQALKAHHLFPIQLKVVHATRESDIATTFHKALLEGEQTGRTFIIVNFDITFISKTQSGGHFAPVGAFDANTKRVLIMDPYREFFEPYWIPEQQLLKSMATKDSEAGKNRGFIVMKWQ